MRKAIFVLFSLLVLSCVGLLGLIWVGRQHNSELTFLFQILFLITWASAIPWITFAFLGLWILPHELAHLLVAKKNCFKILFIDILGFQLWFLKPRAKMRYAFSRSYLGMVVFGKKNAKVGEIRQAIVAGPLANLLCGIALLPLAITGKSPYWTFIQILTIGHFWIGISNLLPIGPARDGFRLLLSYREPEKVVEMANMWYESLQLQLVRPREWNLSVFKLVGEPLHDAMIYLYWYWSLMDKGQILAAEAPLRQALAIVLDSKLKFEPGPTVLVEVSTYFSRFCPDLQTVESAKAAIRQVKFTPIQLLSLKAVEKWSKGKKSEAVSLWKSVDQKYCSSVVVDDYKNHSHDWFLRIKNEDMVFETDRLLARLWREGDLSDMVAIYVNPEVRKYLGPQPTTPEEVEAKLKNRLKDQDNWPVGYGAWALVRKEDEKVIGAVFCDESPKGEKEIAWHLAQEYWGCGYATEAALGLKNYIFEQLPDLGKARAVVIPENEASRNVAKKIGMESMGKSDADYGVMLEVFEIVR